jgi:hypothetical protein
MKIHPVVQHLNGTVTVALQASFVGDITDTTDRMRIAAYGDPLVNLGGLFISPALPAIGTLTLTGIPNPNETFTISTQLFTWIASGIPTTGQVLLGTDAPTSAANIITAITAASLTPISAAISGTSITITAVANGEAGNQIAFENASSSMTMDGSGTLGGTQWGREALTFQMGSAEVFRGVTTQMAQTPVSFMAQLPLGSPGLLPTQSIVSDPVDAAAAWCEQMDSRISLVMTALRGNEPPQLVALPDSTV